MIFQCPFGPNTENCIIPDVSLGFVFHMIGYRKLYGPHSVINMFFLPLNFPRPLNESAGFLMNGMSTVESVESLVHNSSFTKLSRCKTVESILYIWSQSLKRFPKTIK